MPETTSPAAPAEGSERRYRIILSNLGYARDIGGSLRDHMQHLHRYLYTARSVQRDALSQLKSMIEAVDPDLCCLAEIDRGSINSAYFNQIANLLCGTYRYHDIENKYGRRSMLRHLPVTSGKSNGFLSKQEIAFDRCYFSYGVKRLIYRLRPLPDLTVYFAHFSLRAYKRRHQFLQLREMIERERAQGEVAVVGDFNIFHGPDELAPLTGDGFLELVGRDTQAPTFLFSDREMVLDLCLCTPALARRASVEVLDQPFSDHAAVQVDLGLPPALAAEKRALDAHAIA